MSSPTRVFVALDFETTGFSYKKERIVEIAGVKFTEDGDIIGRFEKLCNPGRPINPIAGRKHGITNEMVSGELPPEDVWREFLEWADGPYAYLAHNAGFDARFIVFLNVPMSQKTGIRMADTQQMAKDYIDGVKDYRLETLVPELRKCSHRGLPDAEALIQLFLSISGENKDCGFVLDAYMSGIEVLAASAFKALQEEKDLESFEVLPQISEEDPLILEKEPQIPEEDPPTITVYHHPPKPSISPIWGLVILIMAILIAALVIAN